MKLFIGCSSSNEISNVYTNDCKTYLNELLKDNDLVFGAYNSGLMGIAYEIAVNNKRNIIGACPEGYKSDLQNLKCSNSYVTDDILERTKVLIKESDALIFLPGGIGTILELIAAIDKKRNGEIDKPIIIYNSNSFFDSLFDFINKKVYGENFSSKDIERCYYITDNVIDSLEYIYNYKYKKNN